MKQRERFSDSAGLSVRGTWTHADGLVTACLIAHAEAYNHRGDTGTKLDGTHSILAYRRSGNSFTISVGDELCLGGAIWCIKRFVAVEHSCADILEVEVEVQRDCYIV